ncbi:hypothetical protein E2562_025272 [Oryza meyeriana var. granulata]|uniref:Uncharacterized protein n=1 Tax=Oryza meyeriana var. granulata TaxID=110450 RepID=A0A6G1BZP7_9ORYZ|nr:hypothetical protein E2562_025272 [Oryza meyeriana var. granulata]
MGECQGKRAKTRGDGQEQWRRAKDGSKLRRPAEASENQQRQLGKMKIGTCALSAIPKDEDHGGKGRGKSPPRRGTRQAQDR